MVGAKIFMDGKSVLVVAFDGLDYDLIQQHDCETILGMEEFGRIDNSTGMAYVMTSELFASFITGKTYREHGITRIKKFRNSLIDRFESWARQYVFFKKWNAIRERFYQALLGCNLRYWPGKDDLESESLFDKIENSKALNVPGWNPSPFIQAGVKMALDSDYSAAEIHDIYEYRRRKEQLLEDSSLRYYDFVMAHFKRPDNHQHFLEEDADRQYLYRETDGLASRIIDRFEDDFDVIIFMSDHGLPEGYEHNENAFYSCNVELFPDSVPEITDFHDKILELVKGSNEE